MHIQDLSRLKAFELLMFCRGFQQKGIVGISRPHTYITTRKTRTTLRAIKNDHSSSLTTTSVFLTLYSTLFALALPALVYVRVIGAL